MSRSILFVQFTVITVMVALLGSGCATTMRPKANTPTQPTARIKESLPKPFEFDQRLKTTNLLIISEFHPEWHKTALETKSKVTVEAVPGNDDLSNFGGEIEIDPSSMRPMVWNPGAEHTIIGRVILKSGDKPFIFESDPTTPLIFRIDRELGYVYQAGRGIVTYPNGEKIQLKKE